MSHVTTELLMATGVAPIVGAVAFVWFTWTIYALRVENGRSDWGKARRPLFAFAVFLHRLSGHPDLKVETDLLPKNLFDKAATDSGAIGSALASIKLDITPLGTFRAMDNLTLPRNPNLLVKWLPGCVFDGIRYWLLQPVVDAMLKIGLIDTGPDGQWREFGWLLGSLGVLGSGIGYALDKPLFPFFGPLVAAGFMLHTAGFYRAGRDRLSVISRGIAAATSVAWIATGLAGDQSLVGGMFVLAAGSCGVAEYLVADTRFRRFAGTIGSTLVVAGAVFLLAGLPLKSAAVSICAGALLNDCVSLRQHLLELKYGRR